MLEKVHLHEIFWFWFFAWIKPLYMPKNKYYSAFNFIQEPADIFKTSTIPGDQLMQRINPPTIESTRGVLGHV
jgi:hypothetical protein